MRALQTSVGLIPTALLSVAVLPALTANGAEAQNPAAFTSDIRPIMEATCWECHGADLQRAGLDLRTRDDALRGGRAGSAIVPGRAEQSRSGPPAHGRRRSADTADRGLKPA